MTDQEILNDFRNVVATYPFHRYDAYISLASDRYGDRKPPNSHLIDAVAEVRKKYLLKTTKRSVVFTDGSKITLAKRIKNPILRKSIIKAEPTQLELELKPMPVEAPTDVLIEKAQTFRNVDGTIRLILDLKAP